MSVPLPGVPRHHGRKNPRSSSCTLDTAHCQFKDGIQWFTATIRIDARVNPAYLLPARRGPRCLRLTMISALSMSLFWFKKEHDSLLRRWHRKKPELLRS